VSANHFQESPEVQAAAKAIIESLAGTKAEWAKTTTRDYPSLHVKDMEDSKQGVHFYISTPNGCVSFIISRYPYCCGALMLYNFNMSAKVEHKLLDAFFDAILACGHLYPWGLYTKNRRIMVMMVQRGGYKLNADGTYIPGDHPIIEHQLLWDYFHTKKVNTRYWLNSNTNHLIHDMEVIL
jgi:hypothetical protein